MKRLRSITGALSSLGASVLLTGLALAIAGTAQAATSAPPPTRLAIRPLTPTEISSNKLPTGTQKSGGLSNTGIGQPFYLEVEAPSAAVVTNIAWSLTTIPAGSIAALAASPLDSSNLPPFEVQDRLTYKVAGRQLLVPDKTGAYTVSAVVSTASTNPPVTVSVNLTAGMYKGAAYCMDCHQEKYDAWTNTLHASRFTRSIDGADGTYRSTCISCHTVGYDTAAAAVNGGFDDVAKQLGWVFPTNSVPGNWAAVPDELKELANIQCENCHGPYASGHATKHTMAVTYTSGVCAQCHDSMTHHFKQGEWNNSGHAVAVTSPTGAGREACVKCHTGQGFVEMAQGYPHGTTNTTAVAINCTACHDPHSAANEYQIRKMDDVTLADGTVVTKGGAGKLCMNCHQSREVAETNAGGTSTRIGPHHAPQADMLAGVNGIFYGKTIPSSAHLHAVEDACVTCHMQATTWTDPNFPYAGGHTFTMAWDKGTPADATDDIDMLGACMKCHGPITTFDFARQDFDGDGVVDGVQTEVQHLLDKLAMLLPPLGSTTVTVTTNYTLAQRKATFNYQYVLEDRSKGIHNAAFAVGLLKASVADLTVDPNDTDGDGLPDAWEIANFGTITAQNGKGDADGDGVDNLHENLAGTNPAKADTDGDGIDDRTELVMGTNPLDAASAPNFSMKIYQAAEIEFPSKAGKTYQVQTMSELGTSTWTPVGGPITGTGEPISLFISTRKTDKDYYRIVELP
jgi:predicted CXXCH cytochrome family protein